MKQIKILRSAAFAGIIFFASCVKNSTNISQTQKQIGQSVSNAAPLSGAIKGTMLSGETYTINGNVTVNAGDTLLIQSGVTINITAKINFVVQGTFISLGTQEAPNWITYAGIIKTDNPNATLTTDPAFSAPWCGINCDTSCALFVMKWTHLEFCGAALPASGLPSGLSAGSNSFAIFYNRMGGTFVLEDSWIYGTVDDAVRVNMGNISVMRNTFEKCGSNTGESLNIKSGTIGDIAYNVFMGSATNGVKASDAGSTGTEENTFSYNNDIIDGGYRQSSTSAHGGGINYEKSGAGKIYNNIFVNDKISLRIVNTADTANTRYGNNYFYGDSAVVTNLFYATGVNSVTVPQPTDVPSVPLGTTPNTASFAGQNNPLFKTFPLPNPQYQSVNYVSGFDFHLQSNSQAIGKGNNTLYAMALVPVDPVFGATEITQPGVDMGAYQTNGKGNQH